MDSSLRKLNTEIDRNYVLSKCLFAAVHIYAAMF